MKIILFLFLLSPLSYSQYISNFAEVLEKNEGEILDVTTEYGWGHKETYRINFKGGMYTFETSVNPQGVDIDDIPGPLRVLFPKEHKQALQREQEREENEEEVTNLFLWMMGGIIIVTLSIIFFLGRKFGM